MPDAIVTTTQSTASAIPDYVGLVKFLITPFLESPDSLKVDCETFPSRAKVLIRVAFDGEDKGRVFGRGGRNIQAIRTVTQALGRVMGHTVHIDIYGSHGVAHDGPRESHSGRSERSGSERSDRRPGGNYRGPSRRPRPPQEEG